MDIKRPKKTVAQVGVITSSRSKVLSKQQISRKKTKKRNGWLLLLLISICIVSSVLLTRADFLQINTIQVSQNLGEVDREKVQQQVQNVLSKKYIYLIPESNIFIANTESIRDAVSKNIPSITNVVVQKQGLSTINISADNRVALYKVSGFDKVFIDSSGMVFERTDTSQVTATIAISEVATALSGEIQALPVGFNDNVGKALDQGYFSSIKKTYELLSAKKFSISSIILYPYADVGFVLSDGGGIIRVNMNDNIENVIAVLSGAKKNELLRSAMLDKSKIDYIDLRFGNKVFFKLR